jgi:uncharacterized membrane protein
VSALAWYIFTVLAVLVGADVIELQEIVCWIDAEANLTLDGFNVLDDST